MVGMTGKPLLTNNFHAGHSLHKGCSYAVCITGTAGADTAYNYTFPLNFNQFCIAVMRFNQPVNIMKDLCNVPFNFVHRCSLSCSFRTWDVDTYAPFLYFFSFTGCNAGRFLFWPDNDKNMNTQKMFCNNMLYYSKA